MIFEKTGIQRFSQPLWSSRAGSTFTCRATPSRVHRRSAVPSAKVPISLF